MCPLVAVAVSKVGLAARAQLGKRSATEIAKSAASLFTALPPKIFEERNFSSCRGGPKELLLVTGPLDPRTTTQTGWNPSKDSTMSKTTWPR